MFMFGLLVHDMYIYIIYILCIIIITIITIIIIIIVMYSYPMYQRCSHVMYNTQSFSGLDCFFLPRVFPGDEP